MIHNKFSVILILIASVIAPVVAPPPPVTSVTGQGSHGHLVIQHSPPTSPIHSPSSNSPSSSNSPLSIDSLPLGHPGRAAGREIKPLPKRSPVVQAKDLNPVHHGSPSNPSPPSTQIGGSSNNPGQVSFSHDNSNAQHHDDQIPSTASGKRKRKETTGTESGKKRKTVPRTEHGYDPSSYKGRKVQPTDHTFPIRKKRGAYYWILRERDPGDQRIGTFLDHFNKLQDSQDPSDLKDKEAMKKTMLYGEAFYQAGVKGNGGMPKKGDSKHKERARVLEQRTKAIEKFDRNIGPARDLLSFHYQPPADVVEKVKKADAVQEADAVRALDSLQLEHQNPPPPPNSS